MLKLASIAAMCSLSATGVVYSESTTPYPVVVDRSVMTPGVQGADSTALSPVVVSNESDVFDVMRQRRQKEAAGRPAADIPVVEVVEPEVIIAEDVLAGENVELPLVSEDVVPATAPVEPLETASSVGSLYQRKNQRLGGASGSDTVETVALEERNDSPRSVTVYASDKAANVLYERDATPANLDDGRIGIGFLFSEERDNVFTANLMLDVHPDLVPSVRFSTGVRAYAALLGAENQDVVGVGLGVEGAYQLPSALLPLEVSAGFFYTPDVFVFGQSDRIIDYNVRAGFQLRDSLHGFVGLRFLQFDTRPGDREVDDKIHVGLRWDFVR